MSESGGVPISEAADQFMTENNRCFMLTLRKDGSPTGHPMGGFYGEGLYLNMYRDSVKTRNLLRDDNICCIVTTPSDARDFRGVLYRGQARLMSPEEVLSPAAPRGAAHAAAPEGFNRERTRKSTAANPDNPEEAHRRLSTVYERVKAGIRIVFAITPERIAFLEDLRRKA